MINGTIFSMNNPTKMTIIMQIRCDIAKRYLDIIFFEIFPVITAAIVAVSAPSELYKPNYISVKPRSSKIIGTEYETEDYAKLFIILIANISETGFART